MRLVLLFFCLSVPLFISSQEHIVYSGIGAAINKAEGYFYDGNGQWIAGKNSIPYIDAFESLNMEVIYYEDLEFVCFTKKYKENGRKKYMYFYIDLEKYKEVARKFSTTDNILRFDVMSQDLWGEGAKRPRNIYFHKTEEYRIKLVFKFRFDAEKKIVRFLFYTEEVFPLSRWNFALSNNLFTPENEMDKINVYYNLDIIESDLLYDSFYYEIDYNKFLGFITSPFKEDKRKKD